MLYILIFALATALPFRFNVFILLPIILFGWTLACAFGMMTASSGASIAIQLVLFAVVVEFGYMVGIVLIWALRAKALKRRPHWSEKASVTPDGTF
jgi:hypothetical protein